MTELRRTPKYHIERHVNDKVLSPSVRMKLRNHCVRSDDVYLAHRVVGDGGIDVVTDDLSGPWGMKCQVQA